MQVEEHSVGRRGHEAHTVVVASNAGERSLRVVPVFTLTRDGEIEAFVGYDVVDSAVTEAPLGWINPIAKGVDSTTALRTVEALVPDGEEAMPAEVRRDNARRRQRQIAGGGDGDIREPAQPTTRTAGGCGCSESLEQ